eukprot:COSAG01_NODE_136_length_24438_cov_243.426711_6_plen_1982_part_00
MVTAGDAGLSAAVVGSKPVDPPQLPGGGAGVAPPRLPGSGGGGGSDGGAAMGGDCRAVFDQIDADGSDALDLDEIQEAIQGSSCTLAPADIAAMVDSMDDDNSGVIDYHEFQAWWGGDGAGQRMRLFGGLLANAKEEQAEAAIAGQPYVRLLFEKLDDDDSGALDLEEISGAIEKVGCDLEPNDVEAMIKSMDEDDSGMVDFKEFHEWWHQNKGQREPLFGRLLQRIKVEAESGPLKAQVRALFDHIDEDESGMLDTHEVSWALATAFEGKLNPLATKVAVDEAIKEMDADGGGTIDFDEFVEWCIHHPEHTQRMIHALLSTPKEEIDKQDILQSGDEPTQAPPPLPTASVKAPPTVNTLPGEATTDSAAAGTSAPTGTSGGSDRMNWRSAIRMVDAWWTPEDLEKAYDEAAGAQCVAVEGILQAICAAVDQTVGGDVGILSAAKASDPEWLQAKVMFDQLDEDHSGILDADEVQNLTGALGMIMDSEELEYAMREMDQDGSGAVDFDEFFTWWKAHKDQKDWFLTQLQSRSAEEARAESMRAEAREMFLAYDNDGSETLDSDEVLALAGSLGKDLDQKELASAMVMMDADGNGEVTFEEFFGWWKTNYTSEGGMFYSFTRQGHLSRMGANLITLGWAKRPASTMPGSGGKRRRLGSLYRKLLPHEPGALTVPRWRTVPSYQDLVKRDLQQNQGRTERALADARKSRGYRLDALWKEMDKDGNGDLDREEIEALVLSIGLQLSEHQLDQAMMEMDADGGGSVDTDEFKQWWDRNIEAADSDIDPLFAGLRNKLDQERGRALASLRRRLCAICGVFSDEDMEALRQREKEVDGIIQRLQDKADELSRKIAAALHDPWGDRQSLGAYVPRPLPPGFHTWSLLKQKEWLLEEERRRKACLPYRLEDRPHDFDSWPYMKQQMWLAQQELARRAMMGQGLGLRFTARIKGFSEAALSFMWNHGNSMSKFALYRNNGDDDRSPTPPGLPVGMHHLLYEEQAIKDKTEYRNYVVNNLKGGTKYTFGLIVTLLDGETVELSSASEQVGPAQEIPQPMEIVKQSTWPNPKVENLVAKPIGFAEIELSWDYTNREEALSFTVYQTPVHTRLPWPCSYEGMSSPQRTAAGALGWNKKAWNNQEETPLTQKAWASLDAQQQAAATTLGIHEQFWGQGADGNAYESVTTESGVFSKVQQIDAVDQKQKYSNIMCLLWPPAEVNFTFAIEIRMRNGIVLGWQTVSAATLPEPVFSYVHAKPISFSDIALDWGWPCEETTAKFEVYRSDGRASSITKIKPTILIASVIPEVDPKFEHYRCCIASGLWPEAEMEYTFGILATMGNGLVLPMKTVTQRTAPEPFIDYFDAETLSPSAISLSWGWIERLVLPMVPWTQGATCFEVFRSDTGIERGLYTEEAVLPQPVIEMASVPVQQPTGDDIDEKKDYIDYVVSALGPSGECTDTDIWDKSLHLSDGMLYAFKIVVNMTNGMKLPPVQCTGWTAPRTFMDWSAAEVALWIRVEVGYPEYADAFLQAGVDGAVASVLSAEDLELDLSIDKWSPRMAILLAIKVMVQDSRRFGNVAIGYDGFAVDRARRRRGPVWDAIKSVDGPPHWWEFVKDVIWGPRAGRGDTLVPLGKKCYEDILSRVDLTSPAQFALSPSSLCLSKQVDLRCKSLLVRPSFFKREDAASATANGPLGDTVSWEKLHPPPRSFAVDDDMAEGQRKSHTTNAHIALTFKDLELPKRQRGMEGSCLMVARAAGLHEPFRSELMEAEERTLKANSLRNVVHALIPDSRVALDQRLAHLHRLTATIDNVELLPAAAVTEEHVNDQDTTFPSTVETAQATPHAQIASQFVTPQRPFNQWNAAEVATWIRYEVGMPAYAQTFEEEDVTGELAAMLDGDDLAEDLGVGDPAARLHLLTAIGKAMHTIAHSSSTTEQKQPAINGQDLATAQGVASKQARVQGGSVVSALFDGSVSARDGDKWWRHVGRIAGYAAT